MSSFILNDEIITKYEKILKRPSFDQEEQQASQSLQVLNTEGTLKDEIKKIEETKESKDFESENKSLIQALDRIYIESPENYWDLITKGRSQQEISERIKTEPVNPLKKPASTLLGSHV